MKEKPLKVVKVSFDPERCKGCGYCSFVCPKQVIGFSENFDSRGFHYAFLNDPEKCIGCGFCALMCPDIAIRIEVINKD